LPTIWLASLSIYQQLDKSLNKPQDINPNDTPAPTVEPEYLAVNNQSI